MEISLETKIQYLKGVGPKLGDKLSKLGIETFGDLLHFWPRKYLDYTQITKIKGLGISNEFSDLNYQTIQARVVGISNKYTPKRRMKITEAVVEDGTGSIKLVWFNQPFLKDVLKSGSEWIFHGKVTMDSFARELIMESPDKVKSPCIVPVYPETRGITSGYLSKLVSSIKYQILSISDYLPSEILSENKLLPLPEAIEKLHFPMTVEEAHEAQQRIAFDELFLISLRSNLAKSERIQERAIPISVDEGIIQKLIDSLPFALTSDQKKAVGEIIRDMGKGKPMNRLLNGDVGSGKTVVAAIAAFAAVKAGFKVAFMVPTEVLAGQHFETLSKLLAKEGITIGLLTANFKKLTEIQKSQNDNSKCKIEPQGADIIVGTQALLQKGVQLENLGLVIVDEQHRFGVNQRAALRNFIGIGSTEVKPHFLSMTATPIPRTMYLALFGDLDLSVINEKPANRKEIKTRLVEPFNRQKAYEFIARQVEAGRQVFVICPLIEEKEDALDGKIPEFVGMTGQSLWDEDKKSVAKEYEKLSKQVFPQFKVAMLHGKMKGKEKEEILSDFNANKTQILVSTSVIEVGIDVPNATVMMIEDADRFGLAQIHQFRGRVGRGEHQSFCFLFSNSRSSQTIQRLKHLEQVADGFKLAEIDLETRGPGDILGKLQSGNMELKMASFSDRILIERASTAAMKIVQEDSTLGSCPELRAKITELESRQHFE